jgi:hypothetical protein
VTGQTSVLTTRVPGQPAEPASPSELATSIASQDQAPDFSRAAEASNQAGSRMHGQTIPSRHQDRLFRS